MKKKVRVSRIFLVLVILYIVYILVRQQIQMNSIKSDIDQKKVEYTKQQEKNVKLQDTLKMIQSEPDLYIEKIAREKLDLIGKDETPVISARIAATKK